MYRKEFGDGVLLAPNGDGAAFARRVGKAVAGSDRMEGRIRQTAQRYSVENTAKLMLSGLRRILELDA
jgi:hypothetical protein